MNFIRQWYEARAKREEAHAKNVAELRQQYTDYELRREHARITALMQIKAQSLLPELVKAYAHNLQAGVVTLNDLAKMALDTVEFMRLQVQQGDISKEVFEQMLNNEWGKGRPPVWLKDGEPIELPLGTLEKMHKGESQ